MSFMGKISANDPATYSKPFISLDIDWAHDEIISDVFSLVSNFEVNTTWMVTHGTDLLSDLSNSGSCELGIHPNFNYLLEGDVRLGKSTQEIVDRMMSLVPEAKVARSHSVCQSSRISQNFALAGIEIESNDYIPANQISLIKPWVLENGITKVPYFFSDELACLRSTPDNISLIGREGLRVFDFHPIHVFLNTESLERYERTRPLHQNPKELIKYRYQGYGTRSRLIELLELCKQS